MRIRWSSAQSSGWFLWAPPVIAVVAIVWLMERRILTKDVLLSNKELLQLLAQLFLVGIAGVAALFSYLRFFKGRLFDVKLILTPCTGVVRTSAGNLHWLDLEIRNVGMVTLWDYSLEAKATLRGTSEITELDVPFARVSTSGRPERYIVDVDEAVFEHAEFTVSPDVDAITLLIILRDRRPVRWPRVGSAWYRHISIGNRP